MSVSVFQTVRVRSFPDICTFALPDIIQTYDYIYLLGLWFGCQVGILICQMFNTAGILPMRILLCPSWSHVFTLLILSSMVAFLEIRYNQILKNLLQIFQDKLISIWNGVVFRLFEPNLTLNWVSWCIIQSWLNKVWMRYIVACCVENAPMIGGLLTIQGARGEESD